MLTGQNGILNRAGEAKKTTEISSREEQRKLAQAEALMNTETTTYKGVTIPEGFASTKIEGEDSLDDGLVITDGYGNEFVWVEVPKTAEIYKTAGIDVTDFTVDNYAKIEEDLHQYTVDYRQGGYSDIYEADDSEGWFEDKTAYDTAKQKMLKSIYQNEGFWISRYEAGIEVNRTSNTEAVAIPVSKANMYPYTYVTRTQAKVLAEKMSKGNYTSSLLYGVQWDLTLKYIENKKSQTVSDIKSQLKQDSSKIGNYRNSQFELSRGKFAQSGVLSKWYDFNSEEKSELVTGGKKLEQTLVGNSVFLTTGATEASNLQNIYDMAGNAWEWTLEKANKIENNPCTSRGSGFDYNGNEYQASFHGYNTTASNSETVSFRIAIY